MAVGPCGNPCVVFTNHGGRITGFEDAADAMRAAQQRLVIDGWESGLPVEAGAQHPVSVGVDSWLEGDLNYAATLLMRALRLAGEPFVPSDFILPLLNNGKRASADMGVAK